MHRPFVMRTAHSRLLILTCHQSPDGSKKGPEIQRPSSTTKHTAHQNCPKKYRHVLCFITKIQTEIKGSEVSSGGTKETSGAYLRAEEIARTGKRRAEGGEARGKTEAKISDYRSLSAIEKGTRGDRGKTLVKTGPTVVIVTQLMANWSISSL